MTLLQHGVGPWPTTTRQGRGTKSLGPFHLIFNTIELAGRNHRTNVCSFLGEKKTPSKEEMGWLDSKLWHERRYMFLLGVFYINWDF